MFEHSSNMTRAQFGEMAAPLACKRGARIKSPDSVIFLGLVLPSVFGMAGDETVRGPTAPLIGPCGESGLQNGRRTSNCYLPRIIQAICKKEQAEVGEEAASAGVHSACAYITDTQH